jgi:uncharacterized protein (DUF1800 family)
MSSEKIALMAHLMRRAGFGATRDELSSYAARGYEETVEELLDASGSPAMTDDLIRRYHHELSGMMGQTHTPSYWLYRMISTDAPMREKMALFWHGIFATGYPKVVQGKVLMDQIRMFRLYGLGSFRTLLVELSRDPAMIAWLDNNNNHNGAINENFGRELLELFSLGVGNYTEQDIKECARAFTGWTIANNDYMMLRSERDSIWPYGRISWHFEYHQEDHDDGEKEFLGERGRFNGEDIVDIICKQQATARFIARHLYHFFVADEPPVPQWPYKAPRDPEAIEILSRAYFASNYDMRSVLRVLFNSEFFKSRESWYEKVKSPAELVAGVLRLTGEFDQARRQILERSQQMMYMGQQLINPPSVEGWHQGIEWIDTGTLVERLNFSAAQFGDMKKPGVRAMIGRILADRGGVVSPERLVQGCLDQMGAISVSEDTRASLVQFASKEGDIQLDEAGPDEHAKQRVADLFQLAAVTPEFQRS